MYNSITPKKCTSLIEYFFFAENANHLSFRQVNFSLIEGPASMVIAADWSGWWLLKAAIAVAIS